MLVRIGSIFCLILLSDPKADRNLLMWKCPPYVGMCLSVARSPPCHNFSYGLLRPMWSFQRWGWIWSVLCSESPNTQHQWCPQGRGPGLPPGCTCLIVRLLTGAHPLAEQHFPARETRSTFLPKGCLLPLKVGFGCQYDWME